MYVPPLFKKKWFWISVVVVLVFAIIWDVAFASFILVKSISSGKWSSLLLGLGLLYTVSIVYGKYLPKPERRKTKWVGRIILLVIAFIAFSDYGFMQGLYFIATVFIFSRFTQWIVTIIAKTKRYKHSSANTL